MTVTDQQITDAMIVAMRKSIDRAPEGIERAMMERELERWESGEQLRTMPEDGQAAFFALVRDFIEAITAGPAPARRRNIPAEQAAAIAERVAQREARKAAKRGGR